MIWFQLVWLPLKTDFAKRASLGLGDGQTMDKINEGKKHVFCGLANTCRNISKHIETCTVEIWKYTYETWQN